MQVWSARVPQRHASAVCFPASTVGLTAVIHVNSWAPSALLLLVPLLPACWLASRPTCAYTLDILCCRHDRCRSPPWHTHGLLLSRVACALGLLVCLAKGSASLVLCCPCVNCLGSEVCWRLYPEAGGGCVDLSCSSFFFGGGAASPLMPCRDQACTRSIVSAGCLSASGPRTSRSTSSLLLCALSDGER